MRFLTVLEICLPVFALMGLGRLLSRRGLMGRAEREFLNALIYYLALPALIFVNVADLPPSRFANPSLLFSSMGAVLLSALLFMALAAALRLRGTLAAAFVFGTFWANITYMGFPLAKNAFGEEGLALAALLNAFTMPFFVVTAFALLALYVRDEKMRLGSRLREALVNPIVLAALLGIVTAFLRPLLPDAPPLRAGGRVFFSFLSLTGSMGLPLALIAIGGALQWENLKGRKNLLALTVSAKLVLMPLLCALLLQGFFPQVAGAERGVPVLLMAMPNAVGSFVISRQLQVEEDFVAAQVILSTILSVITIPVWLFFLI